MNSYFVAQIKINDPERKEPNLQNWANDFRLMVERDMRTVEQINYLMKWSGQHPFWHTVIHSPTSMRRNWDQMVSQVKQGRALAKGQVLHIPKKPAEEFILNLSEGEAL